jgi:hypothetical protein
MLNGIDQDEVVGVANCEKADSRPKAQAHHLSMERNPEILMLAHREDWEFSGEGPPYPSPVIRVFE